MMNVTQLMFVLLGALSTISGVLTRALPSQDENSESRISKRSVADVIVQENVSKYKKHHERKLLLSRILEAIDTSGSRMEPFPGTEATLTTTFTSLEHSGSRSRGSGEPSRRKGRKHKRRNRSRSKRKRRNRKMGKNRRGSRSRRDLTDAIAALLESQDGEKIINAVASVVGAEQSASVERAREIIRETADKCECRFSKGQGRD